MGIYPDGYARDWKPIIVWQGDSLISWLIHRYRTEKAQKNP